MFSFIAYICIFICIVTSVNGTKPSSMIQLVHLTDVHGWINAHPHDENIDADFGDLEAMIEHLKDNNKDKGKEFLLFDTGDLIEGTGLSDATPIHGEYIYPIMEQIPYDGVTVGNHDIGHKESVQLMQETFIPILQDRYISTNVLDATTSLPLGSCFRIITIDGGYKVLVLGFIYDFLQGAPNTYVVFMEEALKSDCFLKAMENEVDMIVSLNHIDPLAEMNLLQMEIDAVRTHYPTQPFILLTGHRHVTYFEQIDFNTIAIESGRYFERFGFLEFTLYEDNDNNNNSITKWKDFKYSWIDANVEKMTDLSFKNNNNNTVKFNTTIGDSIKQQIATYVHELGLDEECGCSPMTYSRYSALNDSDSFYSFYIDVILPINSIPNANNIPFYFSNCFALRDDMYKGLVVRNDLWSIAPFNDTFRYIKVTGTQLQKIVVYMDEIDSSAVPDLKRKHILQGQSVVDVMMDRFGDLSILKDIPQSIINDRYMCPGDLSDDHLQLKYVDFPHFVHTNMDINPNVAYNLIGSDYDIVTIMGLCTLMFPNDVFTSYDYIGKYGALSSTQILEKYVHDYMVC